jgi:DNA primase
MADAVTQLIKEKIDIVEFLKGYLSLVPAGRNFKALCPFHTEKTPSFSISPDRGTWHCFGCSSGGDIFEFLMKYEHIEFAEALKILAEKAGVPLQRLQPAQYKAAGLLYDVHIAATSFFQKNLSGAPAVRSYLRDRGLRDDIMDEFCLGWSPNEPDATVVDLIRTHGFSPDDLITAGVAFRSARGMVLDRFRGRIVFPIHNHLGRVVGFTGRIFPLFDTGDVGKYVNSPETPIFNKSRILYGFYKTKEAIHRSNYAFVVEGQMDFLASYQAGISTVVASSGTAFTYDHLHALSKVCGKLIFNFDSDDAGIAAGDRAVDMAHELDFEVLISSLPHPFKDPAEAMLSNPQILHDSLNHAVSALSLFLDRTLGVSRPSSYFATHDGLVHLRLVLAKIAKIKSVTARAIWMQEVSRRTGISIQILEQELSDISIITSPSVSSHDHSQVPVLPTSVALTRHQLLSFELLSAGYQLHCLDTIPESVLAPGFSTLLSLLRTNIVNHDRRDIDAALHAIVFSVASYSPADFSQILEQIHAYGHQVSRQRLIDAVRIAEQSGNEDDLRRALSDLAALDG